VGINQNTKTKYYTFEKGESLDFAIKKWNEINGKAVN
jgi:hypothetical protein